MYKVVSTFLQIYKKNIIIFFLIILTIPTCFFFNRVAIIVTNPHIDGIHGDFYYKINRYSGGKEMSITGLTYSGKKADVLVFPTTIKDLPVTAIGWSSYLNNSPKIEVSNATKIYIPNNFYRALSAIEYNDSDSREFFLGRKISDPVSIFNDDEINFAYYGANNYIDTLEDEISELYTQANVVYYMDNTETDYFFVDDVDGTTVNVKPPNPLKEDYQFLGWYKDSNYTSKWDFKKDKVQPKIYDDDGNYIFVETKIYAKWG